MIRIGRKTSARCDDQVLALRQLTDQQAFAGPEMGFSMLSEDSADRHAYRFLNPRIRVEKLVA
jgi:hypothetical protein